MNNECFCGTELEAGLCPNGHDPIALRAATPPPTPSAAVMRAAEEIHALCDELAPNIPNDSTSYAPKVEQIAAIITRRLGAGYEDAGVTAWRNGAMAVLDALAGVEPLDASPPTRIRALRRQLATAPSVASDSERETLIYWLLRCYESGHRQGWEPGPNTDETMDGLLSVLANRGYDPKDDAAKELLKQPARY